MTLQLVGDKGLRYKRNFLTILHCGFTGHYVHDKHAIILKTFNDSRGTFSQVSDDSRETFVRASQDSRATFSRVSHNSVCV